MDNKTRDMLGRRLLYVAVGGDRAALPLADHAMHWDICQVGTLAEAAHALRASHFLVGLLNGVIGALRPREVDQFLRAHSHVHWVGVVSDAALASDACRDLIADHLYDYHSEPVDGRRLADTLGHVHGWASLRRPRPRVTAPCTRQVGVSSAVARLREQVERVARTSAPVLIWGESGSGKELAAKGVHEQSARARAPFIAVNCGAIAPNLIQSELFGYERGAFTGATRDKVGLLEAAHGGTIFLDEIADLPRELQATLLRFLQEKTITRLGATRAIPVDVRVIAASHVDLQDAVARGAFREDLYYRLAVLPITVPPLRERRDDLMLLAEHFFAQYADEKPPRLKGFSSGAASAILSHHWPGNVRELMNRVRRAMVMAEGRLIAAGDLGFNDPFDVPPPPALDDTRQHSERVAIQECLDRSGHNVSRAARTLGVSRTTMYRLLSKHGLHL
ncbi:sigma-54 dependent transcriptional regulator [Massilia sp. S19_KUP03_FR1]|uniref:sigma-54 dependent transcriptional regulator n=1 Tax=Massilia sp. S19_KUP03_FR1 TaxID=3025503 RepID=UPI002FCDB4A0